MAVGNLLLRRICDSDDENFAYYYMEYQKHFLTRDYKPYFILVSCLQKTREQATGQK